MIANRCTGIASGDSFSAFSNSATCSSFVAPTPPRSAPGNVVATARRPSPQQIALSLVQREIAFAPRPRLRISPSQVGLTGLDSFFWLADRPQPISASAGPVTAQAYPAQYTWDFGDGERRTTSTSGRRWTRRRDGNVAHLYEKRGAYSVSVDVIWEARWRVGTGAWQPLGYFTTSDSAPYSVRQVVALLVRSRR
ncbi:MAG TPA: PKD domain-containing protein [Actinomycetota bacterium]|nr:PKD domain-containing protein [Actinomycetota bacterium]